MSDLKNINMDEGLLLENEEMNGLPIEDDPKPEIDNEF